MGNAASLHIVLLSQKPGRYDIINWILNVSCIPSILISVARTKYCTAST
jgi:hypothetical protein